MSVWTKYKVEIFVMIRKIGMFPYNGKFTRKKSVEVQPYTLLMNKTIILENLWRNPEVFCVLKLQEKSRMHFY